MDIGKYNAFIEGNSKEDLDKLRKFRKRKFNWCAFFFSFLYFAYRKLYIEASVIFVINVMLSSLDLILSIPRGTPTVIWIFVRIAYSILVGFLFYPLYKYEYRRIENLNENEIRQKGGTNSMAIVVYFMAVMVVGIVVAMTR